MSHGSSLSSSSHIIFIIVLISYCALVQSLRFARCIISLKFKLATIELAAAFGSTALASSAGIPASVNSGISEIFNP